MPVLLLAVILAIIQGLCEFLPVSSSGHLVLAQNLFGLQEPELAFDIALHLGTLLAVLLFYARHILTLCLELRFLPGALISRARMVELYNDRPDFRFGILVIVGSIPTALIGLFFKDVFLSLFDSVRAVGIALIITGCFLWRTGRLAAGSRDERDMTIKDALFIGLCQGLAITPGISRSGATIGAGLLLGLRKELAARYSFIMSIPAILGATILEMKSGVESALPPSAFIIGFTAAGVTGYLALNFLVAVIRKNNFSRFAWWCWPVGLIAVAWSYLR